VALMLDELGPNDVADCNGASHGWRPLPPIIENIYGPFAGQDASIGSAERPDGLQKPDNLLDHLRQL